MGNRQVSTHPGIPNRQVSSKPCAAHPPPGTSPAPRLQAARQPWRRWEILETWLGDWSPGELAVKNGERRKSITTCWLCACIYVDNIHSILYIYIIM